MVMAEILGKRVGCNKSGGSDLERLCGHIDIYIYIYCMYISESVFNGEPRSYLDFPNPNRVGNILKWIYFLIGYIQQERY